MSSSSLHCNTKIRLRIVCWFFFLLRQIYIYIFFFFALAYFSFFFLQLFYEFRCASLLLQIEEFSFFFFIFFSSSNRKARAFPFVMSQCFPLSFLSPLFFFFFWVSHVYMGVFFFQNCLTWLSRQTAAWTAMNKLCRRFYCEPLALSLLLPSEESIRVCFSLQILPDCSYWIISVTLWMGDYWTRGKKEREHSCFHALPFSFPFWSMTYLSIWFLFL